MSHLNRSLFLTATAIGSALALSTTLGVNPASAGSATTDLTVTAAVNPSCNISTETNLSFGTYNPNNQGDTNVDGGLSVSCTAGTPAVITLGQGSRPGPGSNDAAPVRRMGIGTTPFYLYYDLYQDQGRTTEWGNTTGTGVAFTGSGVPATVTIYGTIPGGQNVEVGSYSDTVVATVTF